MQNSNWVLRDKENIEAPKLERASVSFVRSDVRRLCGYADEP